MGTAIDVIVDSYPEIAERFALTVFAEIERLERVFNWFDRDSELRRWSRGETKPGKELAEVLALAELWKRRSRKGFDPAAGSLVALWARAVEEGCVPSKTEIAETLGAMNSSVDGHSLNAIAKGWIVDQAVRQGLSEGPVGNLVVNAGGDLLHHGAAPIIAGIEDPRRPFDNVPPLLRVRVDNMALATSGGSRRGWTIDGERYSHIIDPRTGWPQSHVESASVIAQDVATADAMATILTVVEVEEGLALSEEIDVGCCIIDASSAMRRNERWRHAEHMTWDTDDPALTQGVLRFR